MHPLLIEWKQQRTLREEDGELAEQLIELFDRYNRWNWFYDERDEREYQTGRSPRPSTYTEYHGIQRMFKAYTKALREIGRKDADMVYLVLVGLLDESFERDEQQQVVHPRKRGQQWQQEKRQDMRENFLYAEYIEQLGETDPIRTYAAYSTFVAIKAVVALFTGHKDAAAALSSVHPKGCLLPDREHAIAFTQREDYDPNDPVWYIVHALTDVPGIWEAAQTLQLHYSAIVRAERNIDDSLDPTELPDDPVGASLEVQWKTPEQISIETAIQAFTAGEGSSDSVAAHYGIGQKKFRGILRERGLMPPRGGNRRG